jgi:hypothetical protein
MLWLYRAKYDMEAELGPQAHQISRINGLLSFIRPNKGDREHLVDGVSTAANSTPASSRPPSVTGSDFRGLPLNDRITQSPRMSQESFEGILIVKRSHRLAGIMHHVLSFWDRWQIVSVTALPHRRIVTLEERSEGPTKRLESFRYVEVIGPDDIVRMKIKEMELEKQGQLLPSRQFNQESGIVEDCSPNIANGLDLPRVDNCQAPPIYIQGDLLESDLGEGNLTSRQSTCGDLMDNSKVPRQIADEVDWCQFTLKTLFHDYTFQTEIASETTRWVAIFKQKHLSPEGERGATPILVPDETQEVAPPSV